MARVVFMVERNILAMCVVCQLAYLYILVNGTLKVAWSGISGLVCYPNGYWISYNCYILNYSKGYSVEIIKTQNAIILTLCKWLLCVREDTVIIQHWRHSQGV